MPQIDGKQLKDTSISGGKLVNNTVDTLQLATDAVDDAVLDRSKTYDFDGGGGTVRVSIPSVGTDAANKTYVDNVAAGLQWRTPIAILELIGNRTIAQINALSPTSGDAVVALDAGTPSAGASDTLAIGDIAEFNGTEWKIIVTNSGGFVPAGTRVALSSQSALVAPYTDGVDDTKIVDFTGASNTGVDTGDTTDGSAVFVVEEGSVFENNGYVYDGAVPTGSWIQFTGAGSIIAGTGLSKTGNIINAGDVNKGVQANADDLQVDASEIAGDGLEQVAGGGNEHLLTLDLLSTGGLQISGVELAILLDGDSSVLSASGLKSSVPTTGDKDLTASVTTGDGDAALASGISATPGGDSDVVVMLNGVMQQVALNEAARATSEFYFSSDGGTTAVTKSAIASGNTLHANGSVLGFQLAATDVIDLLYVTT